MVLWCLVNAESNLPGGHAARRSTAALRRDGWASDCLAGSHIQHPCSPGPGQEGLGAVFNLEKKKFTSLLSSLWCFPKISAAMPAASLPEALQGCHKGEVPYLAQSSWLDSQLPCNAA